MTSSAGVLALGLSAGGCSFSYQLGSLFGKDDEAAPRPALASENTGAIGPASVTPTSAKAPVNGDFAIGSADITAATMAATAMLAKGGKDISAPWENPTTGAHGTVTPVAAEYQQDGFVCREFLASFVTKANDSWLQGEACRVHRGQWVVRALKPWKSA